MPRVSVVKVTPEPLSIFSLFGCERCFHPSFHEWLIQSQSDFRSDRTYDLLRAEDRERCALNGGRTAQFLAEK